MTDKSRHILIGVLCGVALTLIGIGIANSLRQGGGSGIQNPIRIGVMLPLTGDAAAWGVEPLNAMRLAQEEIDNAGGIDGAQLEFIVENDKCDPATAASAAQKLISVDKIKIIFGGGCSGETLAAAPIAEEAKVLLISPLSTSPDITNAGDYVFRTAPSDAGQGAVAARFTYENMKARRAAIIAEQTDYAEALARVFRTDFEKQGGTIAAQESFQSKDTDLRAQILKIKRIASLDIIYLVPQSPATAELLFKQLKAQEVTTQLVGSETTILRDKIKENPALFAGLIATEPYFDETSEHAKQFLATYEEKFNAKPSIPPSFVANAYSQTYLLKEGIEKVGFDVEKLKAWLYTVKGWKHVLGELTIDEHGDALGQYAVQEIQSNGELKQITVVKP